MTASDRKIVITRAPMLTLWAAVVAERLGLDRDEALTMGKALAGFTAHAKGVRLGIYEPTPETMSERRKALAQGEEIHIDLYGTNHPDGAHQGWPAGAASRQADHTGKRGAVSGRQVWR